VRKQEREEEAEEERRRRATEARKTEPTMTPSVAEEATIALAGDNRACSDGRSGENKYNSGEGIRSRSRARSRGSS